LSLEEDVQRWLSARAERVIETSCARVYLTGDVALKVKKPVDYGFLDFSTLEKRKWALDRELAFNAPFAPDIYRRVLPIVKAGEGFALEGEGPLVEWALEMRRFDPADVLSEQPQALTDEIAEALGRRIARAHIGARVVTEGGGARNLGYTISTNCEHQQALAAELGPELVDEVVEGTTRALRRLTPMLEARAAAGFSRHCHGDLHLGNILLENGTPKPFDCIEFNDRLSEIDTLYDLAFTLMDLSFRGRSGAANRVMNAYLDEAARGMPPGLLAGLEALPLMLSTRASVRSHVDWHGGEKDKARAYLRAAAAFLKPSAPRLVAVGGVSGTGKTTVARLAAPHLGPAPGAVILRTDEVRKRLFGVGPRDSLSPEAYAPFAKARVQQMLLADAAAVLAAGRSVVLDATHLARADREAARALARRAGVPFHGAWLDAPDAVLEGRIGARRGDASDATVETLRMQRAQGAGPVDWPVVDSTDPDEAAKAILEMAN
jgi:hypothetical protein